MVDGNRPLSLLETEGQLSSESWWLPDRWDEAEGRDDREGFRSVSCTYRQYHVVLMGCC